MYCKNCGNELPESAKFCGKCGVKVETVVSDVNKKSVFTKKHMIMITAVGCILIFAIIMVVLLWKKPSQDTDAVAENTTESIEESTPEEETVAVTAETEETEEELEEAEPQYYLARETKYRRGFIESVSEYNSDGNCISSIDYDEDGNVEGRNQYKYDSNGNEVSYVYYNEDGSVNSRYEREYDSAGNEVRFISYKEDGSVNSRYEREYEYDVTGNCISNIYYNEDGEIINSWKSEYDNTGNEIKCVTYNGDGSINSWIEYTYDSNGEEPSEVSYNADGSISVRREYEYDSAGNEISFAEYNGDGSLNSKRESEYDSSGRVIKNESYYASSNENWMTEYEYDSSGNLIKDISYVNGEIAFINEYDSNGDYIYSINYYNYYYSDGQEYRYEYKYDNNGNCLLNKKYYYPQGDIYWLEEKKYDEQGRIVEERNYEYSETAFGDERRYYEYDNNGNLMKEEVHFYDENGAEWDFAEIIYEYKLLEEFENLSEAEGSHRDELITEDVTCEEAFEDCILENALQEQEAVGNPDELQYLYFYHDFNGDNNDELVLKKTNYYSEDTIYIYSVIGGQVTLLLEREDGTYYEEFNALTENGFIISGTVTNGAEYHYYVYSMNDNEVNQTAEMHSYEYEGWSDDACNEYEIVIEDEEYYTKDAEEYNDKLNQYLEENIVTNIPYNSPIWIELCDDILE